MILRSKVQIAPLSLDAQEPRRFNTRPFEVTTSKFAQVAQLVEQGIENPRVGGSIPSLGTIIKSPAFAGLFGNGVGRLDENHRQRFDKMRPQKHFGRQSEATAPRRGESSEGNAARIIPSLSTIIKSPAFAGLFGDGVQRLDENHR